MSSTVRRQEMALLLHLDSGELCGVFISSAVYLCWSFSLASGGFWGIPECPVLAAGAPSSKITASLALSA